MPIWVKYVLSLVMLYVFWLLQVSFLIYFPIFGQVANLVFILYFIFVIYNKNDPVFVFFISVISGFLLGALYEQFFGLSAVALIALSAIILKILKLFRETGGRWQILYFIPLFALSMLAYLCVMDFAPPNLIFLSSILYNTAIASVVFFLYKYVFQKKIRS